MAFATGSLDDRVRLRLGGDEILIAESWDVVEGVMATPGVFALELGSSTPFVDLFLNQTLSEYPYGPKYPKGTKFELFVGDDQQMSGRLEGYEVSGAATRIALRGRDNLAALARCYPEEVRSFTDSTYEDFVRWALDYTQTFPDFTLSTSNTANRQIKAGIAIKELTGGDETSSIGVIDGQEAAKKFDGQTAMDESLLSLVRRVLDRAGLFLWSGARDNTFILGSPDGAQEPAYRLVRKRGSREASNIIDCRYVDDATDRHGGVTVYGRGGGRAGGRAKAIGGMRDDEMVNLAKLTGSGWGFQGLVTRDFNVYSIEQAEYYARRKLAEERRRGWSLTYRVSGHRLTSPDGTQFPVITPDTTICIEDDELGLGPGDASGGTYYIESVRRMRNPATTTELRLMRPMDLIFATGE